MGLLVELSPEGTAGDTAGDPAAELEAELLALVGAPAAPGAKAAAKAALPLEALERMAALCLRDQDDEDDEELGDEADLMVNGTRAPAGASEVLGDGDGDAPAPPGKPQTLPVVTPDPPAEVTPDPPMEVTPDPPAEVTPAPPSPRPQPGEVLLRERQREYKVAALDAKRRGDLETATRYYRVAKVNFDPNLPLFAVKRHQVTEGLEPALEAAARGRP
ncbi:coiled-coil and C2 domain-containing protein 1A-like, partial [Columba livia]